MEVLGKIKVVNAEQVVSTAFKKRELVVTTDEQFPQHIVMEFTQDKCDILNGYKAGDNVKVSINLRGRLWVSPQGEDRYFNTIQAWRIEKMEAETEPQEASEPSAAMQDNEPEDLPF